MWFFFQGRISCASNVWSFGVTAWEIFTLCQKRPFHALTDIGTIEFKGSPSQLFFNDAARPVQGGLVHPKWAVCLPIWTSLL